MLVVNDHNLFRLVLMGHPIAALVDRVAEDPCAKICFYCRTK